MAGSIPTKINMINQTRKKAANDTKLVAIILTAIALIFFVVMLLVPLISVFLKAFEQGASVYYAAISDPMAMKAIKLTLTTIAIVVPINTTFGLIVAWAVAKFKFKGKNLLITIIDLPFAISPVVAGLIFVLLFSTSHGLLAPLLTSLGIKIIFAPAGIVIATLFVTLPFVARELIPLMEAQGTSEEEAALTLGASGLKTFWLITLPNVKWALLYGIMLTAARAAGEFGAVSVVSGHIRGLTNTLPLHVEILYNEYKFSAAFAVASLLTIIAIINLIIKNIADWRIKQQLKND
ncbi:sulfate ABC transporter, inner membrane subunit CysW [Pseudobacteroides cellulosolvens ATCC 35603 = DSM 2933]|uniref:Sulfate ABC transporter, inner membrane subunit CysW n=2 Tax=Pseudobacteroides cellulosolvens TaxID=35825 RepID=A0A0L6JQI6_9FIRM|nr:sulfate ABC transporter permease subunit CysW [Pseudobacteroides cellulosolvens]KNY28049.1 sulfate ABC transporter, inner membrane subunit CysW [Pseudobacteroides cellulosolvens ATCC 35603 = DSM 2933]